MLIADPGRLTGAAGDVDASADAIAALDIATPFSDVSDALAGSQTTQASLWLSTRLAAAVQVYAQGLTSLADAARSSAEGFTSTDVHAAGTLEVHRR